MLSKKYNENDVRQLFSGHGTIEECTVLRDPNCQSKGCAFVTYSTKQSAKEAIKVRMNYSLGPSNSKLRNGSFKWQVCFVFYKMVLSDVTRHTK